MTTLGQHLRVKHGFAFKSKYFVDSGELILLTPGNFAKEGGLQSRGDREKHYDGPFPEEYLLRRGDLLIAMTDLIQQAPILGSSAVVPANQIYLHNQRLGKVVDLRSDLEKAFLYHLFNWREVRDQIKASATGATVRHTAPERIYAVSVPLPPPPVQRRIADILSAYDDLIENNTRRIKTLEEMAQRIYREWFVRFRFPGHENVPLVPSDLGPIPQGWELKPLARLLEHFIGGGWGKEELDAKHSEAAYVIRGTDIPGARHNDISGCPHRYHTASNLKNRRLSVGDIVLKSQVAARGSPLVGRCLSKTASFGH